MAKKRMSFGRRMLDSVMCALAVSAYFAVVLPLQSYIAYSDNFTFDLGDMVFACGIRTACLTLLLGAVLLLTYRWCKGWLHLALIGLTLAAVAESGPGSIGLPELNGEFAGYRNAVRGAIDAAVLAAVFAAPLLLRRQLKGHLCLVSMCLMLFTGSSLFDVKRAAPKDDSPEGDSSGEMIPRTEVLQCAKFSTESNVILLVLDAMGAYAVQDILSSDPALASEFVGFVNYVRNVGMHNPTQVGLPGLLTGRHFQSGKDIARYGRSYNSQDSVLVPYVEKNIPVYFNVSLSVNGYTNRRIGEYERTKPEGMAVLKERMQGVFALTVDDICAFRIMPYLLKERFLSSSREREGDSNRGAGAKEKGRLELNVSSDDQVWPFLATRGIDGGCPQTFHVHHTLGGHVPITHDEYGNEVKCPNPKYEDYRGQCKFSLRCVARMFGAWKANGVYDASTIIIAADHGSWIKKPGMDFSKIPSQAFPVLMVKPRASRDAYCESDIPTTHANVSKVIKALASRTLTRAEMEDILATDEPRLFRLASGGKLKDWYVSRDGSVEFRELEDSEPTLDEIKPLEYGVDYDFRAVEGVTYPDFRVEGGNRVESGGLSIVGREMTVCIKVPGPCELSVLGTTFLNRDNEAVVELDIGGELQQFPSEFTKFTVTTRRFASVTPDEQGVVRLKFKIIGKSLQFVLKKVKLSKIAE